MYRLSLLMVVVVVVLVVCVCVFWSPIHWEVALKECPKMWSHSTEILCSKNCASLRTSEEPALINWLWEGVPPGLLTSLQTSQAMMKEEVSVDLKAG